MVTEPGLWRHSSKVHEFTYLVTTDMHMENDVKNRLTNCKNVKENGDGQDVSRMKPPLNSPKQLMIRGYVAKKKKYQR